MPVKVVLDHPQRHIVRRLRQHISAFAGAAMVVVGLTASIAAVPTSIAALSFVIGWIATSETDPEPWPPEDMPVRDILLVWAISTPITIVGLRSGIRLLRGRRRLVLFLRRFGYDDATSAVTFAVATIGRSWRLVTLDDAEIAPLGVPIGTRRLFRASRWAWSIVLKLGHVPLRVFPAVVSGMWVVVGIALLRPFANFASSGNPHSEELLVAFQPYLNICVKILDAVQQRRVPFELVSPDLPGVFAVLGITAALMLVGLIVSMVAAILSFPFTTLLFFVSSSLDAVRDAERSKTAEIRTAEEIRDASLEIAARSRKVFGPRLVVLRVATAVWQQAVNQLADVSTVALLDVSVPTDNLLWELEELTKRFGARCVIIGQYDRVNQLSVPSQGVAAARSFSERVAHLLDGRDVLAYTTDRPGMRRFAHALRGTLMSLHSSS